MTRTQRMSLHEHFLFFETYQNMVDDRAAKGFNLGQLFVAANGWGRVSSLLDETYSILDVKHMQKVDSMIAYANSKGMTVWVHGWWARKNLDKTGGEEKMKRWWRYLVHRLGAYNVIWVGGEEYNLDNYGGLGLSFWKDLGRMIKEEDPYNRILGMHNTPPTWGSGMILLSRRRTGKIKKDTGGVLPVAGSFYCKWVEIKLGSRC